MPGSDLDATDDAVPPKPSVWQRLSSAMMKPAPAGTDGSGTGIKVGAEVPTTVPELEAAVKRADDKERLVGLILAPIAAALGLLITGSLIANDPKTVLANGQLNKLHVNPSLYLELGGVTVCLAVLMLATAWFRKRLYLGMIMALYGISIFNLHFWGFGLPYIVAGAWLLMRAYRLQTKLKEARAAAPGSSTSGSTAGFAGPNKRYTPPTPPPGRVSKSKPGKERKAG
jgi:hypothetical protein